MPDDNEPRWISAGPDHEDQFFQAFKAGFDQACLPEGHRLSDGDLWVLYWEWLRDE